MSLTKPEDWMVISVDEYKELQETKKKYEEIAKNASNVRACTCNTLDCGNSN